MVAFSGATTTDVTAMYSSAFPFTVILQTACLSLPSSRLFAIIWHFPFCNAFTLPACVTVAIVGSEELQATPCSVALSGSTFAVSVISSSSFNVASVGVSVSPVTGTTLIGSITMSPFTTCSLPSIIATIHPLLISNFAPFGLVITHPLNLRTATLPNDGFLLLPEILILASSTITLLPEPL